MELFCGRPVCVGMLSRFAIVVALLIAGSTVAFAQFQGNDGGGAVPATKSHTPGPRRPYAVLRERAVRWAV